jgi:hypothetical protein
LTSDRKIKANRANARVSTGPKTRHGRARSAKNAFRHGLSLPAQSDQALCEEVQTLARQIAGQHASAYIQILASRVAEAQVDLRRIRRARHQFLSAALADRYRYESRALTRTKLKVLKPFLTPKLANVPLPPLIEEFVTTAREGPGKFATVLSKETKRLLTLDRYERRALSRRKFAIRAFDEARRQAHRLRKYRLTTISCGCRAKGLTKRSQKNECFQRTALPAGISWGCQEIARAPALEKSRTSNSPTFRLLSVDRMGGRPGAAEQHA